ncbi:MAG: ferritin-like domain-containing protein [Ruminococcaceae bacterium]|nr:ferritin-like domain-containing protein [Oscillospiraceae bacterium]
MTLTPKESSLLKDLMGEEQLCVAKYQKYAAEAKAPKLKSLLSGIATTEQTHLKTLNDMSSGKVDPVPAQIPAPDKSNCCAVSYENAQDKQDDAFLCKDLLATEKHASALYNTCVFEFSYPEARKMLNHIQAEEQQHGEVLYSYMNANGMYN